jgi:hypothetical protein
MNSSAKPLSVATKTSETPANPKALPGKDASKAATPSAKATAATEIAKAVASPPPPPPPMPKAWAEIKVGSLVIAQESAAEGWWEAVVAEINGDKLTLRWRDYPRYPTFVRGRSEIAFLAKAA